MSSFQKKKSNAYTQAPNTVDNDSSSGLLCTLTIGTKLSRPPLSQFSAHTSYFHYGTAPSMRADTYCSASMLSDLCIQVIQQDECTL